MAAGNFPGASFLLKVKESASGKNCHRRVIALYTGVAALLSSRDAVKIPRGQFTPGYRAGEINTYIYMRKILFSCVWNGEHLFVDL